MPRMVYTDGSAMHPRDRHLRVAGWSIVWRDENGDWTGTGGRCRGQQSAARAEIEALIQVCLLATAPCVITSDCKGAVLGFRAVQSAQSLPKHLAKGSCADLWQALLVALKGAPSKAVRWMPAHCTKEDLCARGSSEEDWTGNDEADKRAKQEARQFAPPDWLVQARGRQIDKEGAAMRIISEIQCSSEHQTKAALGGHCDQGQEAACSCAAGGVTQDQKGQSRTRPRRYEGRWRISQRTEPGCSSPRRWRRVWPWGPEEPRPKAATTYARRRGPTGSGVLGSNLPMEPWCYGCSAPSAMLRPETARSGGP